MVITNMQSAKDSVRALHSLLTRRKRFTSGSGPLGLDLAYITDRVIVCSFPYELPVFFSRNTAGELLKFLETTHRDHYKIYNLCSERHYDHSKFKGRVSEFPINVNEAPQLYTIYSFIKDMNKWLDADAMNVVCVHCDNGRDRTGMMVSSWLLQTKRCLTASHAITFFASVRGGMSPCVTIPSQRRYVEYVERVLSEKMPAIKLVVLEKITIYTVPMFNIRGGCSPWFSISKLNKSIFYSKSLEGKKGKMSIDFECNFIQLQGDIVITFFDGKFSRLMFRISFHSSFIRGKTVTFYPRDVDGPHADVNHKNFNPEFKVTLHFSSVALLPAEQISADDVIPQTKKYTFDDVLSIPTLRESFRAYLDSCSENLDFWRNVQRYKESYAVAAAKSVATKIHNKYLLRYSPDEVNVSGEAKADVGYGVNAEIPARNLFDLAEREIYSLMRNDSYPRFIISDLFFKACADLSDYVVSDPSTRAPISSKSFRANTATHSNSEKTVAPKRYLTAADASASGSIFPLSPDEEVMVPLDKYDYSSPFKTFQERKKEPAKREMGIRLNHSGESIPEIIPRMRPVDDSTFKRDNLAKQDAPTKPNSARPVSPPSKFLSFLNPASSTSTSSTSPSPSPSPRAHDDKRGDFIKGDYRSNKGAPSSEDNSLSHLQHLDLSSGDNNAPLRRESASSPNISSSPLTLSNSSPAAFVNLQSRNIHGSNKDPAQSTSLNSPSSQSIQTRRPSLKPDGTYSLSSSSSSLPRPGSPSHMNTPPAGKPPRPLPVPSSTSSSSHSDPQPSISRKSVAQQIQAFQSRPPAQTLSHSTSDPNISVNFTTPTPKQVKFENDDRSDVAIPTSHSENGTPNTSRTQKSTSINQNLSNSDHKVPNGTHVMLPVLNLSSSSLSPHSEAPPRPETPSSFSPSMLSFDKSIPHEFPSNSLYPSPSRYPINLDMAEQSESLKVMQNVKLVCVECRKQIGNKDVVVSFMHHYYHWSCVLCFKCRQPLSSDCVICGDKPYCGKCEDDFFNKCKACGLAITETSEEQRTDDDGKLNCWHRSCFACWVCGLTSNSESPIERFAGDNKLYCVFHHPEPKTVPVMSAQDIREDVSDDSPDLSDDSSDDDSPLHSLSASPPTTMNSSSLPPSLAPPPRSASPSRFPSKPLPAPPSALPSKTRKPLPPLPLMKPTVMAVAPPPPPSPTTTTTTSSFSSPPSSSSSQRSPTLRPMSPDDAYFAGTCTACCTRIPKTGNLLLAGGHQYHPSCFNCCVCARPITGPYQEHEGSIYCPAHRGHAYKSRCLACNGAIGPGVYVVVQGEDKYHVECFTCKLCGLQFGTDHSYYNVWGGHICVQCYAATCEVKRKSRLYRPRV